MKAFKSSLFVILCLLLLAVAFFFDNQKVCAAESNLTRLSGKDRYETASAISKQGWTTSKYVILARGDSFPDALCASPLAKKYDAPILLTDPKKLSDSAYSEIKRLKASNVIIIGGVNAVSEDIEKMLSEDGITVERIWGSDRYDTSVEIAKRIRTYGSIVLATGDDFPDALSVSAIAAIKGMPILLVKKNVIPPQVQKYIDENGQINKTYIIGGKNVINDAVFEYVREPERISGNNRYETNIAVLKRFSSDFNFDDIFMAVADGSSGDEFADALSGSALAAKSLSPVVLVYKRLPEAADYYLRPMVKDNTRVIVLGGKNAVPDDIANNLLYGTGGIASRVEIINPPETIKAWETKQVQINFDAGAQIKVFSSNTNTVVASVSGRYITVTGISPGSAVITVQAEKEGFLSGSATFLITSSVYNATRDKYYDTIQSAIDDARSGDMIRIAPGVYYEHIVIKENNLKLIGEDRDSTIIDASQSGKVTRAGIKIQYYSGNTFKNLTIRNAGVNITSEADREPYGIYVINSNQNVFDNLRLKSNGTYEFYLADGSSYNTVQNSIIDGVGVQRDGYRSLDGIFSCGGEENSYGKGTANTGNRFIKNVICNVVYGISLTASYSSWIMNNEIHALDSAYWKGYNSTGVVISNSSMNLVQNNLIDSSQSGIRLSVMSSISPYNYAGAPNSNIIRDNRIFTLQNGIKIVGDSNLIQNNNIKGNAICGLWLSDTAKYTEVSGNILTDNNTSLLVENVLNQIHLNRITGGTILVNNTTDALLDVTKNWWGDISGPPIQMLSGNLNYSPWALDEYCTKFSRDGS